VRGFSIDICADRETMWCEMAAGTSYVAHGTAGPKECYVHEGGPSKWVASECMPAPFRRAEAGSEHGGQTHRSGCAHLLSSSRRSKTSCCDSDTD
jgi:hypothetical protein